MLNKDTYELHKLIKSKINNNKGQDHFSPSQIVSKPFAWWIIKYLVSDQDERRKSSANYKMHFGNLVGNTTQRLISKYIFVGAEREEIKDKTYEVNFDYELNLIKKESPRDEKDKECRDMMIEFSHSAIKQTLKAVKQIFGDENIQSERYVNSQPDELFLPLVGRIDFESNEMIAELKTKPPYFRDNKSGLKPYTQKLPEEPNLDHVAQLSFYFHCTKKKPILFYVNNEDFKIFDEFKDEYLEYCYQTNIVRRAKTIQRLLEASRGNASLMAELVEAPDLKHYLYSDLTEYQHQQITKLWGI